MSREAIVWQNAQALGGTVVALARARVVDEIAQGNTDAALHPLFMYQQDGTPRLVASVDMDDEPEATLAIMLLPLVNLPVTSVTALTSVEYDGAPAVVAFSWDRDGATAGEVFPYRVVGQTVTWLDSEHVGVRGGLVDAAVRDAFVRQEPTGMEWATMLGVLEGLVKATGIVIGGDDDK